MSVHPQEQTPLGRLATSVRCLGEAHAARVAVSNGSNVDRSDIQLRGGRRRLANAVLGTAARRYGIPKPGHTGYRRCDLLVRFWPFGAGAVFEIHERGDVA